jgi:hypothetical protein
MGLPGIISPHPDSAALSPANAIERMAAPRIDLIRNRAKQVDPGHTFTGVAASLEPPGMEIM